MSTTIKLSSNIIRAALLHAAVKDVRYYLGGVLLEPSSNGLFIVATDGHRMLVHRDYTVTSLEQPTIIPTELLKVVKSSHDAVEIIVDGDKLTVTPFKKGKADLTVSGSRIDGRFPDWRRIVPTVKADAAPGIVDARYAHDAAEALRLMAGDANPVWAPRWADGGIALMTRDAAPHTFVVVMDMRETVGTAYVRALI